MKRVALAAALLVIAGTASAAIFVPPPAPGSLRAKPAPEPVEPTKITRSGAPPIVDTGRPPVPFVRLPPPPAPQMATLVDQPPAPVPAAAARSQSADSAKAQIERGLSRDGRCVGRPLKSVRVDGNGAVHVQC